LDMAISTKVQQAEKVAHAATAEAPAGTTQV
jgi:hypothetical protein